MLIIDADSTTINTITLEKGDVVLDLREHMGKIFSAAALNTLRNSQIRYLMIAPQCTFDTKTHVEHTEGFWYGDFWVNGETKTTHKVTKASLSQAVEDIGYLKPAIGALSHLKTIWVDRIPDDSPRFGGNWVSSKKFIAKAVTEALKPHMASSGSLKRRTGTASGETGKANDRFDLITAQGLEESVGAWLYFTNPIDCTYGKYTHRMGHSAKYAEK